VPRGTHDWNRFVTPRELAKALRAVGLRVSDEIGVTYNPLAAKWQLSHDTDINYMMAAVRPE
jgi:2-polyprenyl-6-hydroxyphenyl methylase/3-demethylubiquinone-9 3-methyltransferase